jgi:hypothetical protein
MGARACVPAMRVRSLLHSDLRGKGKGKVKGKMKVKVKVKVKVKEREIQYDLQSTKGHCTEVHYGEGDGGRERGILPSSTLLRR